MSSRNLTLPLSDHFHWNPERVPRWLTWQSDCFATQYSLSRPQTYERIDHIVRFASELTPAGDGGLHRNSKVGSEQPQSFFSTKSPLLRKLQRLTRIEVREADLRMHFPDAPEPDRVASQEAIDFLDLPKDPVRLECDAFTLDPSTDTRRFNLARGAKDRPDRRCEYTASSRAKQAPGSLVALTGALLQEPDRHIDRDALQIWMRAKEVREAVDAQATGLCV